MERSLIDRFESIKSNQLFNVVIINFIALKISCNSLLSSLSLLVRGSSLIFLKKHLHRLCPIQFNCGSHLNIQNSYDRKLEERQRSATL